MSKALTLCGRLAFACDMALGITLDPKGNRCKAPPALDELADFVDKVQWFADEFSNTAGLDEVPDDLKLAVRDLVDAANTFNYVVSYGRLSGVMHEANSLRVAVGFYNQAIFESAKHV